jgi:hypothetical protein
LFVVIAGLIFLIQVEFEDQSILIFSCFKIINVVSKKINFDIIRSPPDVRESESEQCWSMHNPTPSGGGLKKIVRDLFGAKLEGG